MVNIFKISLILSSLAVMFSSCRKDSLDNVVEPGTSTDRIELTATAAGQEETRLSTDIAFNTSFETGDAIGIFAVHREEDAVQAYPAPTGNYAHNYKYVRQEDGSWTAATPSDQLYYTQAGLVDIYAYYPYVENADPTAIGYDASVSSYDLMTARYTAVGKGSGAVNLVFNHKLALVQAEVSGVDMGSGVTVIMNNSFNSATLNLAAPTQGAEMTVGSSTEEIPLSFDRGYFRTYVPAQTVEVGTELFYIDAYGNDLYYRNQDETVLAAGSVKRYSIRTSYEEYIHMPNCYMIYPGGTLSIPVGKAFEAWETHPRLQALGVDMSGTLSVEGTWMYPWNLITNANLTVSGTGKDAVINIATTPTAGAGNAVISLKVDGVIRWSWHVWVSNYNPNDQSLHKTNNGFTFMDRNLGATTNTPGNPETIGLHYFWGRKDPFPGPGSWENTHRTVFKNMVGTSFTELQVSEDNNANLLAVMSDPFVYMICETGSYGDWYSKDGENQWYERWANEDGSKGIFDPCPGGWKVPSSGAGSASPWYELTNVTWSDADHGITWYQAGYYPAGGILNSINSTISWTGECAYYYSSSWGMYNGAEKAYALYMDRTGSIDKSYAYTFSHGLNIRCVKE